MKHNLAIVACVLALALWVSSASAQADLGLKGVGLRVGMVDPEGVDAAFAFGIFTDLGTFHPKVNFETYVDYWSKSYDTGGFGEVSFRDIIVGAKGQYMFALSNPLIRPYVGAGLSMHFLHGEASTPTITYGTITVPGTTIDTSDAKLGLDMGGGVRMGVADNWDITGDLWYTFVSDINQFSVAAGFLYKFM
jgi:hypothetical protein